MNFFIPPLYFFSWNNISLFKHWNSINYYIITFHFWTTIFHLVDFIQAGTYQLREPQAASIRFFWRHRGRIPSNSQTWVLARKECRRRFYWCIARKSFHPSCPCTSALTRLLHMQDREFLISCRIILCMIELKQGTSWTGESTCLEEYECELSLKSPGRLRKFRHRTVPFLICSARSGLYIGTHYPSLRDRWSTCSTRHSRACPLGSCKLLHFWCRWFLGLQTFANTEVDSAHLMNSQVLFS